MTALKIQAKRFLRWSEKYTKTDMVFVASTGGWALLAQFINSAAAFLLALLVAHFVSKTEYGTYQYILTVVGLLSVFSLTGLGSAVMQSVAKGFDRSLEDGFRLNLCWSAAVFLGSLGIGAYYLLQGNFLLATGMTLAGLSIPFRSGFNLYSSFLNGKKDTVRSALWVSALGNVVPIVTVGVAVVFFPSAMYLVLAYVVGNLGINAYLYWRVRQVYPPQNNASDPGLASYSKHMSVANILNAIASNLDNLLLFHYLGAAEVAVYSFATALPDQLKAPLGAFGTMMTAKFAERSPKSIRASMKNKLLWLSFSYVFIVAGLVVVIPYFYSFFFPKYIDSVFYAQLYAVSLLSGIFVTPGGAYLAAHKLVKAQYIQTILSSLFQIISMFIGVVTLGLLGLVIARLVTRFFGGFLSFGLYEYTSRKNIL